MNPNRRIRTYAACGAVLALLGALLYGCRYFPESTFTLAKESRLPKWISLPPGYSPGDVSIKMSYHIPLFGGSTAHFEVNDSKGIRIEEMDGKVACLYPLWAKKENSQESAPDYPSYEAISVKGVTDMVEHKKMEPFFYMTDDASVWNRYRATGCR